jgi:cobalamin synthase
MTKAIHPPSGMWTSKLGALEDIEHQLGGLTGDRYGKIGQILKRSK